MGKMRNWVKNRLLFNLNTHMPRTTQLSKKRQWIQTTE